MRRSSLFAVLGVLILVLLGVLYFKAKIGAINIPDSTTISTDATSSVQGLAEFSLPEGLSMHVFAQNVPNARVMIYDPKGTIVVSEPSQGQVVALTDTNNDGVADQKRVVVSGLKGPHGLAFDCASGPCTLYIAEENAVRAYAYDPETKLAFNPQKVADLPSGGGHSTRSLLFLGSPNEHTLLISVGSSCNVCNESDDRRAKILAYDTVSKMVTEYAKGLRNSVFMTLNPVTGAVWATEMGRDGLGDDMPPDEINIIEKGKNYGWPICYGQNIHDTEYDKNTYIRNPCMAPLETPAKVDLQAHSAPLGIGFIPEEGWPEEWWYDAIVAFHGSWNRSVPTGYKIVRIPLDSHGNLTGKAEDFITGWMRPDGKTIGRPVGILVQPGGKIFISDDQAGIIYEVRRNSE